MECTTSLNADDFYKAVSRFIARRGVPQLIRSDNARTFKCGAERLSSIFKLSWKFNIEKAPWQGGVWERLVRNVKTALRYAIVNCKNNYQDVETLVTYVERVVNCRPITYVSSNDQEILPITPNNFLLPMTNVHTNQEIFANQVILKNALSCNSKIINHLWTRWKREYLTTLNKNLSSSTKSGRCLFSQ